MHSLALDALCSIVKKEIQCDRPCGGWLAVASEYNASKPLYEVGLEAKDGSLRIAFPNV